MNIMNTTNRFIRNSKMFFKRHSPAMLSFTASIGVVATAILAARGTVKAARCLDAASYEKGEALTKLETFKVAAPLYIPSLTAGITTISCIMGAHVLNRKQQTALIGAYTMLSNSYKKYREKTKDIFGEEADKQILTAIAKDKYIETIEGVPSNEKQLYFEPYYNDYFESTREDVLTAEHRINEKIAKEGYAGLNDFYTALGLPKRKEYEDVVWSYDSLLEWGGNVWVDFVHDIVVMDDGLETTFIAMTAPVSNYLYRFRE